MALMSVDEAIMRGVLPDYLSIFQWAQVIHPSADNAADRKDYVKNKLLRIKREIETERLIVACKNGLPYDGNIEGWSYLSLVPNPYPLTDNGLENCPSKPKKWSNPEVPSERRTLYIRPPCDCVINKSVMKPYLISLESAHQSETAQIDKPVKTKKPPIYEQRIDSFETWLKENEEKIDLKALAKEPKNLQERLIIFDNKLWNIKFESFMTEFWHEYSKELCLNRQRGQS